MRNFISCTDLFTPLKNMNALIGSFSFLIPPVRSTSSSSSTSPPLYGPRGPSLSPDGSTLAFSCPSSSVTHAACSRLVALSWDINSDAPVRGMDRTEAVV